MAVLAGQEALGGGDTDSGGDGGCYGKDAGTLGTDGEADGKKQGFRGDGAADNQVDFTQGTIEGDGGGGRTGLWGW